ncbi:MAG TPA: glycosyltransferase family 1 protein [Solirubrobacteraceae bacterium]|nr:glycosyltransferase family 1 protein [Solirubrobacteraceae bacterium]
MGLPVGLGTYAANLLRALDRREDENQYFVYAPTWSEVPPLGPRFRIRRSHVPRSSRAALTLWDLTLPAIAAAREPVDLIHYLHPAAPAFSPGCPVVVNMLDAIGWAVPGYRLPQPYEWLERRAVGRVDLVLTLSESARADIERLLGVSRAKIRITYLGAPALDPEPSSKEPYFLFVGGTEKRKNLGAVLQAFSSFEGFELRVVGAHTASPVHDARREQTGVRWLGHVSEGELVKLYRQATALVFPSRYEGFGLPLLEAMARRTPVIAANGSSIPEVTRGAAILVDPDDIEALRDAMRRVADDEALREELTRRGTEVVSGFSWDETARATVAAYEELGATR